LNLSITSLSLIIVLGLGGCAFRYDRRATVIEPTGLKGIDAQLWESIKSADVIYVGEVHDHQQDHAYELRLIEGGPAQHLQVAVGWEMFHRINQPLLDQFDRQRISLNQLLDQTGFKKSWGVYSPVYAKILAATVRKGIPNVGLNATDTLVHHVAMGQALSQTEARAIPTGYRVSSGAFQNFVNLLGNHPGMAKADLHRYFDAQNIWDQTMADSIIEFHRQNPGTKLIVLSGRAHVQGGFGVPGYVAQKANLRQLVILPGG
jgi:aminopeptidase N